MLAPNMSRAYDEVKRILLQDGVTPLSTVADPGRDIADWMRESRARMRPPNAATRWRWCAPTATKDSSAICFKSVSTDANASQSTRGGSAAICGACSFGVTLPIDVSGYGIERFDVAGDDWPSEFQGWLNQAHERPAAAP